MQKLTIDATKSSPQICFDCENNVLAISGESFPEDAALFYLPVFDWLNRYLPGLDQQKVYVKIEIRYFNSSSSKIFMDLFELLDEWVKNGKSIEVCWITHEEDDMGVEFGEEFKECVVALPFQIVTHS
ncbi:MAG: DUF1987 domain-containing protein [Magnetococcus sp. YQC-5]